MKNRFSIKVIANAKKTEDRGVMTDGTRKIAIAAPRDKGRANAVLKKFLAKEHGCTQHNVRIVLGDTNSKKVVEIEIVDKKSPA